MIDFKNRIQDVPYLKFYDLYNEAVDSKELNSDAAVISSFSKVDNFVDSRFVNIKYVIGDEWIFFSNYQSNKAKQFKEHSQISALFFWRNIHTQVRIKANIYKSDKKISNLHFLSRTDKKNALSISSQQSMRINSFDEVENNYNNVLNNNDLYERPFYWGGYSFKPYEFEFWKGSSNRLNKRELFVKNDKWDAFILQP